MIIERSIAHGLVVSILLLLGGCTERRDPNAVLDDGQTIVSPVVEALAMFRRTSGRYPAKLDELTSASLLASIPELPEDVSGVLATYPLTYEVDPLGRIYRLSFAYDVDAGWIALPDVLGREFVSCDGRWRTVKYPERFDDILLRCARQTGTGGVSGGV